MLLKIGERPKREAEEAETRENENCKRKNKIANKQQKEPFFRKTEDVKELIQRQKQVDRVFKLEKSVSTMKANTSSLKDFITN